MPNKISLLSIFVVIVLILVITFYVIGINNSTNSNNSMTEQSKTTQTQLDSKAIPMADFNKLLNDNIDITILDVRTADEFNGGHIPKAINLDVSSNQFESEISKLDKSKTYAIYCRSGNRSLIAYYKMQAAGFGNLYNAKEGFTTWENLKLPIEK